jgi:quercetin dioxygenase-like cupin family protein
MKRHNISGMKGGWFAGMFEPAAFKTDGFEAALKTYEKGACEPAHYHMLATEITLVAEGAVEMAGEVFRKGDICVLSPGETSAFRAIENSMLMVIKTVSAPGDKYLSLI